MAIHFVDQDKQFGGMAGLNNNNSAGGLNAYGNIPASGPSGGLVDLSRSIVPTTRVRGIGPNIELTSIVFIALPPLGDQFKKQLDFHVDGTFADELYQRTGGFTNIRPDTLSDIAGRALYASAETESVNLPNRDQKSYLVLIELMSLVNGYIIREVTVGFTSHDGITQNGAIDPNMVVYIGSVTTFKQRTQLQSNEIIKPTYYGGCQVISDVSMLNNTPGLANYDEYTLLRPVDVISTNALNIQQNYDARNNLNVNYMDTTVNVGGVAKISNVDNLCPNKWLGDIITAYIQPMRSVESEVSKRAILNPYGDRGTNEFRSNSFFNDVIGTCSAREPSFTNTLIYKGVFKDRNEWGKNHFTIQSLSSNLVIPKENIHVFHVRHQHNYSDFESWKNGTGNARVAYGVLQTMPHILLRFMLSRLTFSANNMIPGGGVHIGIGNIESLFNKTLEPVFIQEIERQIKLYIIDTMILPTCAEFSLVMDINVLHVSTMEFSVNGGTSYPYMMPTFAESFMSMMSTKDHNTIIRMSNTMDDISTHVHNTFGSAFA